MKHAFLITAYNEPEILKHELKMLDHAKVDIFIHIDKKADLSAFDFLQNIGISDKKRPKISCNPFIYYSFEQKTFR